MYIYIYTNIYIETHIYINIYTYIQMYIYYYITHCTAWLCSDRIARRCSFSELMHAIALTKPLMQRPNRAQMLPSPARIMLFFFLEGMFLDIASYITTLILQGFAAPASRANAASI